MFIKNKLATYLNFTLGGKPVSLNPGAVGVISDEQAEDDYLGILIERGMVERAQGKDMSEQVVEKQEVKAVKTQAKIPVRKHEDKVVGGTVVVKCAGVYKNGKKCGANVNVAEEEFDSDKPYFCGRHAGESADDYEKVDGEWTKKAKPKKRQSTKKTKAELEAEMDETLTNVEMEEAIKAAKESPEKPRKRKASKTDK